MTNFICLMALLHIADVLMRISWLSTGNIPIRTSSDIMGDLICNLAIFIWAVVLIAYNSK